MITAFEFTTVGYNKGITANVGEYEVTGMAVAVIDDVVNDFSKLLRSCQPGQPKLRNECLEHKWRIPPCVQPMVPLNLFVFV